MLLRRWKTVAALTAVLFSMTMIGGCGGGAILGVMRIASAAAHLDREGLTSKSVIRILADISGYTAVRRVVAIIKKADGIQDRVSLSMDAPGQYTVEVPLDNSTTQTEAQNYTVVVEATDSAGNTVQSDPVPVEAPPGTP